MAGYRLTLKRLAREHGLPLSGLTYRKLITKIVEDNARRAHRAAGKVSALRYRRALGPAEASGEVRLPEYAVGAPTLRKAAENGAAITDALRDSLTRSLRSALRAHPEDPEAAIAEMSKAVGAAMAPYARRDDPAYPPSHVQTIAVTEVRSALDLARFEYARRFVEVNPSARLTKVWRHNGHLVKVPRPGHLAANGQSVPLAEPFRLTLPSGAVLQAMHPHDPTLPAEEVIGCQCSYEVRVEVGPAFVHKSFPPVTVENPTGSVRRGRDRDGKPWATLMHLPYGFIDGTVGADGEEVDCFVGPDADAPDAYVFTIHRKGSARPDEDKVMLGFRSGVEAQRQLQAHYDFPVSASFRAVPAAALLDYLNGAKDTDRVEKGGANVGDVHRRKDGNWRKVAQPDEWERVTDETQGMAGEPGGAQAPRGAVGGEGGRQDRKDLRGDSEAGGRGRHGRAELLELSGIPEGELTAEHPNGAFEMSGPAAARWYRARLDELRRDHPLGLQVSLKSEEEYRGMRLFSSSDGNALLAVDGRDIVSVSARKVGYEDEAQPATMPDLIRAAVASGARTADCYGTYLPSYYEQFGLRPVARLKWDQGVWDGYAASEVEAGRAAAGDAESSKLFAKWNGGKPDYFFLAYGKPYGEDVPYVDGWDAGVDAQEDFLASGGRVEKDTRGKVDIGGTVTRPDGTTWKRTSTFGYSKVSDGPPGAPVGAPEPDEGAAPTPKELAMAGPEWKEYLESEGPSGAARRMELKKLIGAKYGVDPYDVVKWKAEIKAAEEKARAEAAERRKEEEDRKADEASRTDLSGVSLSTLTAALERDGLRGEVEDLRSAREWMSTRYVLDEMPKDPSTPASKRLLAEYEAHPESRLKLRPLGARFSEVPRDVLVEALDRDGLLGGSVPGDLDAMRKWMSTRYVLDEMPKDPSTPAGKRLLAEYTAHPESRLKLRPSSTAMKVDEIKVEPRPHWSPDFGKKLAKVFNDAAPSASVETLTDRASVTKAFGTKSAAMEFVKDVEDIVGSEPTVMRFHIKDVARHWAKEPRTKNLFETGRGHGSTDKGYRAGWEHKLIDFTNRSKGREVHDTFESAERPSYGMIGSRDHFKAGAGDGYGDSTLILKPEVRERTTFTLGNSSGESGCFRAGAAHKLLDSDRTSALELNKRNKERCVDSRYTYIEAQMWGGVDLSKDVSHIVVSGKEWERSSAEDRAHMKAVADRCGIELRYRDGEVLYSPGAGGKPAAAPAAPDATSERAEKALAVPIGTVKRDLGPDGTRVYKVKAGKFTWLLCDETGKAISRVSATKPSRWAVTWTAVKPEEMVPTPAPEGYPKKGSKDTYTKGGKVYLKHDASVPVGGIEVRADGTKYRRTSKFTWSVYK